jgi:putative transposase
MRNRNSYHSTVKIAYALDIHKQWLPDSFIKSIPRSTSHAWRYDSTEKYIGQEYAIQINDNVEELKLLYDEKVALEKRLFVAYTRIKLTIFEIFGRDEIKKAMNQNYKAVLTFIMSSKNSFEGGVKTMCKFLDIRPQAFSNWLKASQNHCTNSAKGTCLKKNPGQVRLSELQVISRLLNRKRFKHWPIASVWAYAVRNNHVHLSLSSWYVYNRKYKFRKPKFAFNKRKQYDPLRAPEPNHTWHADVTIVKTLDGVKNYVYLIVDNYSKLIINWKVSTKCNGEIRAQTIREAVYQEFGEDLNPTKQIDLIVDGGTENNNKTVEQFIKQSQVAITKKIALKDIVQSNSMVEASNKILKHQYLFKEPQTNTEELISHLKEAVFDFCKRRPHCILGLYTPYEIHYNCKPQIDEQSVRNQYRERIKMNQTFGCGAKC